MKSAAILCAFNLEKSIGKIVKETQKFVDFVIVVSDGSSDKTNEMAKKAGAECPKHTKKRGKGFAVRKGIKFCRQFNPKYIVLMDADGQHLPEEIPKLLRPLKRRDVGMVVGSRMKGVLKTSIINRIGNFGLKMISFLITWKWLTDTESGFRAFRAKELYKLDLHSTYYEIESELLLRSIHNGLGIVEVPITVPKAVPGVTVMDGINNGLYKIKLGLKLKFSKK